MEDLGIGMIITEDSYLFVFVIIDPESDAQMTTVLVFARECYYDDEAE